MGDTFNENVEATRSLLKCFVSLKTAQELASELRYNLDNLEASKGRDPTKDHSATIARLTGTFENFQGVLRGSTIDVGHNLRQAAREFDSRLTELAMKETPTYPTTIITTTPTSTPPTRFKTVQLPKIALPTFNGNLMEWTQFWGQFKQAVHSNPELTNPNKLAYLRDSIRDPATCALLYCGTETISAAVVDKVTCDLPLQGAEGVQQLPHIKDLPLADPTFHQPEKIDLLLGEDILHRILLPDVRVGTTDHTPVAWKTVFGWAIRGPFIPNQQTHQAATHVATPTVVDSINQLLTRFWEAEEPPSQEMLFTPEEEQAQNHYNQTHKYLHNVSRYQVSLPKDPDSAPLGESQSQAVQRYLANERSLLRKGSWQAFQDVVQEYLDLGHAQPVSPPSPVNPTANYYLPMHGFVKESSTTTKLRVVFDASAKSTNHNSLNDMYLISRAYLAFFTYHCVVSFQDLYCRGLCRRIQDVQSH